MKDKLKTYYDAALNKTEISDKYFQGMWNEAMKAVRSMGDEVISLEKEVVRLRGWLMYISDSDSSVVPGGFHETMAEKALNGEEVTKDEE
jgi:hypothetical protein